MANSENQKLKVIVIGLGNAGSRFDEEKRNTVWSHTGAYLYYSDFFEIVNGVDPSETNRIIFNKRLNSEIAVSSLKDISSKKIDVVSIATPYEHRFTIFEEIFDLDLNPKVIICEKPLASKENERKKIISICDRNNCKLLVHYNRRFINNYQYIKELIIKKDLGNIYSITIKSPNRIWSVGSHAIDLLLYYTDEYPIKWEVIDIPSLYEDNEKAFDFIAYFPSGIIGRVSTQGPSKILIFEVELNCELGRVKLEKNGEELIIENHKDSKEYNFYKVPEFKKNVQNNQNSSFLSIVKIAREIINNNCDGISTGFSASVSEKLLDNIVEKI